jgi:hypothetical protein
VPTDIADLRMRAQGLAGAARRRPAHVVAWLGAVQAQEYLPAKWALALRLRDGVTEAAVERAVAEGAVLRTHVLRPTWHFVTPADIRWMLELTAPHVHKTMAPYDRHLELDARTMVRGTGLIERSLRDGAHLTRTELSEQLARAGIVARGPRLAHLVMYAELEGVICSGPFRGSKPTYALVAHRAPGAKRRSRDEALGELMTRFCRSHGPATARDAAWWSGLPMADVRRGLEICRARPETIDGLTYWTVGRPARARADRDLVHLLPIYDEYLVAYRDRAAVPHGPSILTSATRIFNVYKHPVTIGGQVAGTWQPARTAGGVVAHVRPARRYTTRERRALDAAAARYARFLGAPVEVRILS